MLVRIARRHLPIIACSLLGLAAVDAVAAKTPFVAVTAIVEHPALDAVREGVRDELKARGFEEGKGLRFEYRSAQGNPAIAAQIARQFAGSEPDVIVAISTPSAQTAVSATKAVPVVFSAVSDPISARLVAGVGASGTNVTGVSDLPPVRDQLKLIQELLPSAKRIGVVYSPGESNSVVQIALLKELAAKAGMTVVEAPAVKSSDVQVAVRSLVGKADLLYLPQDNAVIAAVDAILPIAAQAKLPVLAPDESSVAKGALATIGFDYYQVGRQTGALVAQVLEGGKPGAIAWQYGAGTDLILNVASAHALGLAVPEAVTRRAKKILGR
jgi:putative ABC transport system substrate-binding protein